MAKYIITDKGEVRVGGAFHQDTGDTCEGRVIAAGHYQVGKGGTVIVSGSSIGYRINSKPEDAIIVQRYLERLQLEQLQDEANAY